MPFDGTSYRRNEALAKIDAVMDLLSTEDRWCKGALKNLTGQRCLMGAMQEASALVLKPYILQGACDATGKTFHTVESFNDRRSTTHALVIDVLHRARRSIEMGQVPPGARTAPFVAWCRATAARLRVGIPA
ncbi:MAG TPA: hypothetical protein VMU87_23185 [Stellaceae bacterium]|nr:hypothetical protein [Stellaceae bacterium]